MGRGNWQASQQENLIISERHSVHDYFRVQVNIINNLDTGYAGSLTDAGRQRFHSIRVGKKDEDRYWQRQQWQAAGKGCRYHVKRFYVIMSL